MTTSQDATALVDPPGAGKGSPAAAEELLAGALEDRRAAAQPEGKPAGDKAASARPGARPVKPVRSRPGNAGGAVGGHKPNKAELEKENAALRAQLAELEGRLEAADPARAELMQSGLAGALAHTFGAAGRIAARVRRAPFWKLEPAETEQLGAVWAPVLAPYMGELTAHAPLVGALVVTYEVIAPRLEAEEQRAVAMIVPAAS